MLFIPQEYMKYVGPSGYFIGPLKDKKIGWLFRNSANEHFLISHCVQQFIGQPGFSIEQFARNARKSLLKYQLLKREMINTDNTAYELHVNNRAFCDFFIPNYAGMYNDIIRENINPDTGKYDYKEWDFSAASYNTGVWKPEKLFTQSRRNDRVGYWTPMLVPVDYGNTNRVGLTNIYNRYVHQRSAAEESGLTDAERLDPAFQPQRTIPNRTPVGDPSRNTYNQERLNRDLLPWDELPNYSREHRTDLGETRSDGKPFGGVQYRDLQGTRLLSNQIPFTKQLESGSPIPPYTIINKSNARDVNGSQSGVYVPYNEVPSLPSDVLRNDGPTPGSPPDNPNSIETFRQRADNNAHIETMISGNDTSGLRTNTDGETYSRFIGHMPYVNKSSRPLNQYPIWRRSVQVRNVDRDPSEGFRYGNDGEWVAFAQRADYEPIWKYPSVRKYPYPDYPY